VDFVQPTWMFNCDPPPEIEATSWRVSLRACLVRTEVLRHMGFLRPEFSTLEAAALEWSHRLLARGVLMRHVPALIRPQPSAFSLQPSALPFADELRFIHYRYGRKWAGWALFRAVLTRYTSLATALRAWRSVMSTPLPAEPPPFRASVVSGQSSVVSRPSSKNAPSTVRRPPSSDPEFQPSAFSLQPSARVTVLIPTVDRYPYLRTLLDQLRRQTVPPCEIIIVDQTTRGQRDGALARDFPDLPLRIINQDEAGQCASRNAGLQAMTGDCVLFIDDDDEVDPDLIERHLHTLAQFEADSSSGIADEVGAEQVKPATGMLRSSDVFPTNNTLARRAVLEQAGLFDFAYNRGQRADGDLGMRVYLSGARMVLNTDISVLHHHAPSGGLRKHKARVVTYASSRRQLLLRNLPSATEFYLGRRYFSKAQVRETVWLRVLGTFSTRGGYFRKASKVSLSALLLPHTLWVIRQRWRQATVMLGEFPKIPRLLPMPRASEANSQ
jgi:glycosyltransferase involved in cell wall biosynthesis